MVTRNILARTFQIRYGDSSGTAFTIDVADKQYLVTARHVVEGIAVRDLVHIYHERRWKQLAVVTLGVGVGDEDVAVLAASVVLSPALLLPASMDGLVLGQDVFFLGFPLGLRSEVGMLNRDFPLPLVKKGIVSSLTQGKEKTGIILIDGWNNPGFSGAPVVFSRDGEPRNQLNVAGVVSAYRCDYEAVFDGKIESTLTARVNTGIIIAISIKHVVDIVESNPLGVSVK